MIHGRLARTLDVSIAILSIATASMATVSIATVSIAIVSIAIARAASMAIKRSVSITISKSKPATKVDAETKKRIQFSFFASSSPVAARAVAPPL